MTDDPSDARFEELVGGVIAPLLVGGPVRPARPFGPRLARTIGEQRAVTDSDLRSRMDLARVRRVRLIAPVDTVADLDVHDFALAAGLNDLLQVTNHELGGLFTRGRYGRVLEGVIELCRNLPSPRTIEAALSRHATFGRVLSLTRTDTTVSWWTGRASFRGQRPPSRLLLWRGLRRVSVDETRVSLVDMCRGLRGVDEASFCEALRLWLACSPLTDIAAVTRRAPTFLWSPTTLSLVATVHGRTLAWRLLSRLPAAEVVAALTRATADVPASALEAAAIARAFLSEVTEGFRLLGETQSGESARRGA